jgi:hypothetical protein
MEWLTGSQLVLCHFSRTDPFTEAIQAAQETKKMALANHRSDLAAEAGKRLELYQAEKPYHGG